LACRLDGDNPDFSEVIMKVQNLQIGLLFHGESKNGADYDQCGDCDDVLLLVKKLLKKITQSHTKKHNNFPASSRSTLLCDGATGYIQVSYMLPNRLPSLQLEKQQVMHIM
jgi:hypothetical protein